MIWPEVIKFFAVDVVEAIMVCARIFKTILKHVAKVGCDVVRMVALKPASAMSFGQKQNLIECSSLLYF